MEKEDSCREIKWVKLTYVFDHIHFGIIKGLLDTADIPVVQKARGIGGASEVLTGINAQGIDIMVPEDRYEEAKDMLSDTADDNSDVSSEDNSNL